MGFACLRSISIVGCRSLVGVGVFGGLLVVLSCFVGDSIYLCLFDCYSLITHCALIPDSARLSVSSTNVSSMAASGAREVLPPYHLALGLPSAEVDGRFQGEI